MALTASKTASCTIAAYRAWANGLWPFAMLVFTAIRFQSRTASAFATAGWNSRLASNMHTPKILFFALPLTFFTEFGQRGGHSLLRGTIMRGRPGRDPRACRE